MAAKSKILFLMVASPEFTIDVLYDFKIKPGTYEKNFTYKA